VCLVLHILNTESNKTDEKMRDLESNETAAAAAATAASGVDQDVFYPFILREEESSSRSNQHSRNNKSSRRRYFNSKKYNECIILFLLITVIALITALVPVAQSRITITIAPTGAANAADSIVVGKEAPPSGANDTDDHDTPAMKISTKKNEQATIANESSSKMADRVDDNEAAEVDHSDATAPSALKEASIVFQTTASAIDADDKANSSSNSQNSSRIYVDYHSNRFDYTSSWCPNAKCHGTPLCYPCQRRWLIIVTVGRSASTTLTKMVNLLPGVRMAGENNDLVGRINNLFQVTLEKIDYQTDAWFHNPIPDESWSCASQTLFTTINPPELDSNGAALLESDEDTILGFKTIRLFDDDVERHGNRLTQDQVQEIATQKVEIMNRLFPCARFIVNSRSDMNSQVASWAKQFHATNGTLVSQQLQADDELLYAFYKIMGAGGSGARRSYWLDSTEWTRNISALNDMIDWLGFGPLSHCHFQTALEYNTKDGYQATKTEADCSLSDECTYLY
jgi:hypothetical protein